MICTIPYPINIDEKRQDDKVRTKRNHKKEKKKETQTQTQNLG